MGTLAVNLTGALLIGIVFGMELSIDVDIIVSIRTCRCTDDIFHD